MKEVQELLPCTSSLLGTVSKMTRRAFLFANALFVLGVSIPIATHAQADAATILTKYSEWAISHEGVFKETYTFRANGTYDYRIRSGSEGQRESGTYAVRGDRLLLTPTGKSTKSLRMWWTLEPVSKRPTLHLGYPDGREEFYYAMVY